MNKVAVDFIIRCFAPGETIAVLFRRENPVAATQRVVSVESALAPRYLGWLAHENSTGANIYVVANPLRVGSRKRTKESIASVRHLYIDIDTEGDARLAALLASEAVPAPTAILSTSPGKYQVLFRSTCPRQGCREADAGACLPPLRQTQSSLLRATHRRCRIGPALACRRRPNRRRDCDARIPPPL